MMRAMPFALAASLLAAPAFAEEETLEPGMVCEVTDSIALWRRRAAKGRKTVFWKGDRVEVVKTDELWTKARGRGKRGFMRTRWLATICRAIIKPSAVVTLEPEMQCHLRDTAAMRARADGRGEKTVLPRGVLVRVVSPGEDYALVESGRIRGYMKSVWLSKICEPSTPETSPPPPPEPPDLVDAPADAEKPTLVAGPTTPDAPPPAEVPTQPAAFGETYKIKVAVMNLAAGGGFDAELLTSLTNIIPLTLDKLGPFKAISSHDIVQMLSYESDKQLLGCTDTECLAEIGGALGADFMITGNLTQVGAMTMIQLQLMNSREARVDARVSREYEGETSGIYKAIEGATKQLVRDILGQRSGRLAVQVTEEGATLSLDGAIVGVTPMVDPLTVGGGSHGITVEKEGFIVYREDVNILEDQTTTLSVTLVPSEEFIRAYQEEAGFVRVMGWVAVGTGVAALGGGLGLFLASGSEAEQLDSDIKAYNRAAVRTTEESRNLAAREQDLAKYDVATVVAAGVGVAAVTTGVLLLVLGEDPDRYDVAATTTSTPLDFKLVPGPSGVWLTGSF